MDPDIVLPPFEPLPGFKNNSTTEIFEVIDPQTVERAYAYAARSPNSTGFLLAQESFVELSTYGATTSKDGAILGIGFNPVMATLLAVFITYMLQ